MKLGASERMIQLRVVKDDGSIIYVGYIYRHWIINEDGIDVL